MILDELPDSTGNAKTKLDVNAKNITGRNMAKTQYVRFLAKLMVKTRWFP